MHNRVAIVREFISRLSEQQKAALLDNTWQQHLGMLAIASELTNAYHPTELIRNAQAILRRVERNQSETH